VFLLLLLIFFIYAVLGVFVFGSIESGEVIDEHTNFHNFGNAMLTLLRIATGEDWNKIMFDSMNTEPDCEPGVTCGSAWAPAYFISFVMLCSFIMLNLFILVILQQFD